MNEQVKHAQAHLTHFDKKISRLSFYSLNAIEVGVNNEN